MTFSHQCRVQKLVICSQYLQVYTLFSVVKTFLKKNGDNASMQQLIYDTKRNYTFTNY